jgi:tape measure domain-containing protein
MSQPIDTARVAVVPDFSGFDAAAQRDIDASLRRIATEAQRAFGQVEREASQAGLDIAEDFNRGGNVAENAIREVSNQSRIMAAQVAVSSAEAGSSLGGRMASGAAAAKAALLGVGLAAGAGLGAITLFGLKSAASLEQTTVGFTSLLHSADAAQQFMQQLFDFAAKTPFEFAGLSDAARRVLAFGQNVGITKDDIIPFLTTLGDLASTLGVSQEGIDAVIRAMGQMSSSGRLLGGDLLQVQQALPGFDALGAIAKHLGVTTAEASKLKEQGLIPAKDAIDGLLEGMKNFDGAAGAMEKQANTLNGVFSTFHDVVQQQLTKAFQPVIPAIKDSLIQITPILGDALGQLAPALGSLVAALLPVLSSVVKGIVPILVPILNILTHALPAIEPLLAPIGEAIGAILVNLAPVVDELVSGLVPIVSALLPVITKLTPAFGDILKALMPLIPPVLQLVLALTPLIVLAAQLAAWLIDLSVKFNIGPIVQILTDQISGLTDGIKKLTDWLTGIDWGALWGQILDGLKSIGHDIGDYFTKLPGRILEHLGDLGKLLVQAGKDIVTGLWNGISSLGGWLANKVGSFVYDNTIGVAKNWLGIGSPSTVAADQVGRWFPAGIDQGVQKGAPGLFASVAGLVGEIAAMTGRGGSSSSLTVDVGGVTVNGAGPVDGAALGQTVGRSVLAAARRAQVALAVRMR